MYVLKTALSAPLLKKKFIKKYKQCRGRCLNTACKETFDLMHEWAYACD